LPTKRIAEPILSRCPLRGSVEKGRKRYIFFFFLRGERRLEIFHN